MAKQLGNNLDVPADGAFSGKTVRIILEENDNIPPTGQFLQIGGPSFLRTFVLRPGEEADVPVELLNILDNAVMSTPITNADGNVLGYRDRLRLPYRVVRPQPEREAA